MPRANVSLKSQVIYLTKIPLYYNNIYCNILSMEGRNLPIRTAPPLLFNNYLLSHLNNCTKNNNKALDRRPCLYITGIVSQHVVISSLVTAWRTLELSHHLETQAINVELVCYVMKICNTASFLWLWSRLDVLSP